MQLIIESVHATPLAATWDRMYPSQSDVPPELLAPAASHQVLPRLGQYTTLVQVRTTDGIEGIGEAYGLPAPGIPAAVIRDILTPLVVGRDAMATEAIWSRLYDAQMGAGRSGGFYLEAISGIDMALWDLRGKALGEPIHRLLGGPIRDHIACYASPVPFCSTPAESATAAQAFIDQGFHAIKLKLGRGVDIDVAHAAAVREAIGSDVALYVDLNCAYDVSTATRIGQALESAQIAWLEEPLAPDDLDGLALLRTKINVPIAVGENVFSRYGAREILTRGAADVLMPNPARCGGISELWHITNLCKAFHVDISPHGVGSGINIAAALQLAATASNFVIYEYNQLPNPLRHGLISGDTALQFTHGYLRVPQEPGLGIRLNQDVVREYACGDKVSM